MDNPRETLAELTSLLMSELGGRLIGLYLFGSLASGTFHDGKSDLDLFAVITREVEEGEQFDALASLHTAFVSAHPAWTERIEVGYVSHAVLQSFTEVPSGRIAAISPGEPFHLREVGTGWLLNWYTVCTQGEILAGPPPLEVGPVISASTFKRAVADQLGEWKDIVRTPSVAYVPAQQGYIVVTLCRALYTLATGKQTSKEAAVAWAAEQYPEWAAFVEAGLARYRADVTEAHRAVIEFTDFAVERATVADRQSTSPSLGPASGIHPDEDDASGPRES
jgi:hypothetical protein